MEISSKKSFYQSFTLHAIVVLTCVLGAFVQNFYKAEEIKPAATVFDMVEPSPTFETPAPQAPKAPQLDVDEIKPLDPIELPPLPEPTPPEPKPEPKPAPKPKPSDMPAPKPDKPKPQETPQKKVSIEEFRKSNPTKAAQNSARPKTQNKPVKVGPVTVNSNALDSTATKGITGKTLGQVQNELDAYIVYIHALAKRKWRLPPSCMGQPNLIASIEFKVSAAGVVTAVALVSSSGNADFDKSVIDVFSSLNLSAPPDNKPHIVSLNFKSE